MAKNNIGGYFVSLGLDVDRHSFETGNKAVDAITGSFSKLIGTARNAAVVMTTTAAITGKVESATYKTAEAIGISTEKLNEWKAAASIAGVNSQGLVSSMAKLADVMNHLDINGQGLEAYSKSLGELGIGINDLEGLDAADAYQRIIEEAQKKLKENPTAELEIRTILGDILGNEGRDFFTELIRTGTTVEEALQAARATQFTDSASNAKAQDFNAAFNTLKEEFKSITALFGSEAGGVLTPYLKNISDWISKNGSSITSGIKDISKLISDILQKIQPLLNIAGSAAGDILGGTTDIVGGVINVDTGRIDKGTDKIGQAVGFTAAAITGNTDYQTAEKNYNDRQSLIQKLAKRYNENGNKKFKYDELPEDIKYEVDRFGGKKEWKAYMKDGIMRPDGTVTQVAPDDWVFAARNVGDLAKMFIPQAVASTANNSAVYNIVQNFTLGATNDMPQVLRNQAYRGVQEGLQQAMGQSSTRLQLMSGIR